MYTDACNKALADTIKIYVEHAKKQGSGNAGMYYQNIAKLKNSLKSKILGDDIETHDFDQTPLNSKINGILMGVLRAGVEYKLDYKDIYKIARNDLNKYADLQ